MSLLKELVQEMVTGGGAVTGAHAIAGARGSLFGGGVIDVRKSKKKQRKMLRRSMSLTTEAIAPKSEETNFDAASVISKIDAAEKHARAEDDTVAFGLEDENGEIVKVYVKSDQSEDFEKAMAVALAGEDADDDQANTSSEIAEVIFKLKDQFEIIDVEWNTFEGDEEEEQEVADGEEGGDMEMDGEEGDDMEMDGEEGDDMEMEADESDAKTALQSVIDVMKADADAKKAEAEAKGAEAKAKEAEYTANAAASKIQQEEQVLDMEAHNKAKADQQKETKKLAQIAKFKHDTATDAETSLSTESLDSVEEMEEETNNISVSALADLIMNNLRAN